MVNDATDIVAPWTTGRLRRVVRAAFVLLFAVPIAPLLLWATTGEPAFAACSELLALAPGRVGVWLRRSFYRFALAECAADVSVGFLTTFSRRDALIEPGVWIGSRCTLGRVTLEGGATLGSSVDVLSGRRQHGSTPGTSVREQTGRRDRVVIGARSWLGNGCTVMADIGADAVIGAGSVVVKPVPDGCVAVGNPARVRTQRENAPCS